MTNITQKPQSQLWADKIVTGILKWQEKYGIKKLHVDDMKTPSGRVHTGSLRGVVLHDLIAKILSDKTDQEITSTYVFNDMDPMDGLPGYLDEAEYSKHMGKPLYMIPAPPLEKSGIDFSNTSEEEKAEFRNAKNFAEFYALDFIYAFRRLGCDQKVIWSHQLYESGDMDEQIRIALANVEKIRKIYKEVADYDLPEKWYPFQPICEKCGKVGTTLATAWDGEKISYVCQENKVEWAKGCGYQGQVSPFGGTGKFLWKVDWPAHWKTMGVTIEGAGKDHTSAGGSRDMANAQLEQVFNHPVVFDIPYEWILIRGAKMSSSKGIGTSAREFVSLFPPQVGRFLFVSKNYNQVIDFDPTGMTIPDLYDEYDQGARIFWGQEEGDVRLARAFELSQIGEVPGPEFLPRFRDVALWMQYPEKNLVEEFEKIKGSPLSELEIKILDDRKKYAKQWLNNYAPEDYKFAMTENLSALAEELTQEQFKYLVEVRNLLNSQEWQPQELQQALFDLAKQSLGAKQGFQAIYQAFIGKKSGPRAGWLLLSLETEARNRRFQECEERLL